MHASAGVGVRAQGFGWTHAGRTQPALQDVDFTIAAGERVLVCGDSGSGKSTLAAAIAGVLGGPDEGLAAGSLLLTAGNHSEQPGQDIPVGLLMQDPDAQVMCARVGDDVAFGCENLGFPRDEIWERVRRALDMVGLDVPLDSRTAHLSGGQKQRMALAGIIAMGAGLIVLDEPTANLDPQGAREVVEAIAQLCQRTGTTLIVIEHNYGQWAGVVDRAIELTSGHITADAPFSEVVATRRVSLPQDMVTRTLAVESSWRDPDLWTERVRHFGGPQRSLALAHGVSTVITGPNGAGKSSWLLTAAGLLPPDSGEVCASQRVRAGLGANPLRWKSKDLAQRIGYVFQDPEHQFHARTVHDELKLSARAGSEQRVEELLERLRLGHVRSANPFTLSGGEKRRLSVATALVQAPQVLLLDEPTFGQDPHTFIELIRIIRQLVGTGVTVASITHDPLYLRALGDIHIDLQPGTPVVRPGGESHAS